jgi:ketosteroid isomerase-like protein
MKTILLVVSLLFLSSTAPVTQDVADRKGIQATIRARFDAGRAAWNLGDIEGYLAGYWDSERTRWASGATVVRGKKAIAAAFRSRFPTPQHMGKIEVTDLEIEVLTGTDALVFGHLVHTVGDAVRKGVFTVHVRKVGGDWFVISDHFSTSG